MKTIKHILNILGMLLLLQSAQGWAEDIDLYSSVAKVTGTDLPNVLFVIDSAANFNASTTLSCTYADTGGLPNMDGKIAGLEQCALNNAIYSLPTTSSGGAVVNVGFMTYNANGFSMQWGCNASGAGGCLLKPLTAMTAANKTAMLAFVKSWTNTGATSITTNNEATAQAMQEAWAYYAGKTGMSGTNYSSYPSQTTGCQKNFVIFIGNSTGSNGSPGDASASPDTQLTTTVNNSTVLTAVQKTFLNTPIQIASGAYGTSSFTCSPNPYSLNLSNGHGGNTGLWADEWARYMNKTDLATGGMPANRKIGTYTIGVLSSSCKSDYPALLTSMAIQGNGKYFATTNSTEIQQAILRVLNEVQAVNSVFSSASLPVSVNAQGTYLNQIFMGMFRPDPSGLPRWQGNLKQYQFGYDPTLQQLYLADALGVPAISAAGTGFLSPNAVSFWTCTNSLNPITGTAPYNAAAICNTDPAIGNSTSGYTGFWTNNSNGAGLTWDLPDGEVVEKGGVAQQIRLTNKTDDYTTAPGSSTNSRKLYTYCPSGAGCVAALTDATNVFDRSNAAITDAMLGVGPIAISQITSMPSVLATGVVPGSSGAAATITITALSKSSSTVTATASAADIAKLTTTSTLSISTGASKYDCTSCNVTSINTTTNTFTYSNPGGSGTPTLPSTATLFTNFVTVTKNAHGLSTSQVVTLSGCTTYTALNGTTATVTAVTTNTFTLAISVSLVGTASDTGCSYTPNTATVTTTAAHNLPSGAVVVITGAGGTTTAPYTGYNGSWVITVTGTNTFTYQYTALAPITPSFNGAGATATSSSISRDMLTRWIRGEDNVGDESSLCPPGSTAGSGSCPNPAINIRPSIHGDVLHSRPVVINYGGTTGIIVYYGDDGGTYHAINGNQSGSTLPGPGNELWGFLPIEFVGQYKRLYNNSPQLLLPSTPPGIIPTPQRKDYFLDGPTGVYQVIDGNGVTTKAYLYIGVRRGGRFIYALDVSNPNAPVFKWKHNNLDAGFSELGQTWSQPKVAMIDGYANPVLIFGAGYDAIAEDTEPPTASTMGRGIFILDANTGALLWSATPNASSGCSATSCSSQVTGMNYSIPSDITLVDRDKNGKVDRLYVGDVGGNVWRVDLNPTAGNTPNFWKVTKLAALGCSTGTCASGITPRKIFYPPEIITTTAYDAIFVTTGDREHPLWSTTAQSACTVTNRAYLLKDLGTGMDASATTPVITETPGTTSNLFDATNVNWDGTLSGYYVTFGACEKGVNAPLIVAGKVYFGTNQAETPNQSQKCEETLGEATGYVLSPFTGAYSAEEFEGGGLPPSPVAGIVNINSNGKTIQVPFCIGCGGGDDDNKKGCGNQSALEGCRANVNPPNNRKRTYWYMENK